MAGLAGWQDSLAPRIGAGLADMFRTELNSEDAEPPTELCP